MTNKIQEANLAMVVSKTFSGLNVNAYDICCLCGSPR